MKAYQIRATVALATLLVPATVYSNARMTLPTSTPTTANLVAPFWFSPVIELVKWFFDKGRVKREDKDKIDSIHKEAGQLQNLPAFLSNEHRLRTTATDLSKLVELMVKYQDVAEAEWKPMKTEVNQANEAYKQSYGDKAMHDFLSSSQNLVIAQRDCEESIDQIQRELSGVADSAPSADKQKKISDIKNGFDKLARCAQEPESVVIKQLGDFLGAYAGVGNVQQPGKQQGGNRQAVLYEESIRGPQFSVIATSWEERLPGELSSDVQGGNSQQEPEYLTKLNDEIAKSLAPSPWMEDLARRHPTSPILPVGGGAVGGLGVAALIVRFIPNVLTRIRVLKPEMVKPSRT